MRILIAPDSFKGSLSATEAAKAIGMGIGRVLPSAQVDLCPIADGGEGTLEALVSATSGQIKTVEVLGPLGEPGPARFGWLPKADTAVVEMAEAAGLVRLDEAVRDPTHTTTFGVGQLLVAALDLGARRIIVGIGGSATNDGGAGMVQALGVRLDGGMHPMTGGGLSQIRSIDASGLDPRLSQTQITVACDVTNPLTGPNGASAIYGPQKGATPQQVKALDAGLAHWAHLVGDAADPNAPGMGAAGGIGFALVAFCGATMVRGIELVLDAVDFEKRLSGCDLVITGEGKLDGQSIQGKATSGVAAAAGRHGIETVALVGMLDADASTLAEAGFTSAHPLCDGTVSPDRAMREAAMLLEQLAANVMARRLG